jgi:hypothetical protein
MRYLILSIYLIFPTGLGPGVNSGSNGYEYNKRNVGSRAPLVPKANNLTAISEPIV